MKNHLVPSRQTLNGEPIREGAKIEFQTVTGDWQPAKVTQVSPGRVVLAFDSWIEDPAFQDVKLTQHHTVRARFA